ncbi:MAG TPA: CDP-alcohol phosphatidyltransferase family protein [Gemmatimonadales bacterium]|nr:CDP-alcohol phosphatidyltransferase family protein [Gemmatimonadales bacterium]
MPETSPRQVGEQVSRGWTVADLLSGIRIPLAVAFPFAGTETRLGLLAAAAASDLLDGPLARRFGSSRFGSLIDPVTDKLFAASAFGVVAVSRRLELYEVAAVLLRDIVAAVAFVTTIASRRPRAIPARAGGKAVTVGQMLTLVAFLLRSPLLRPMAWATAAIGLYAIWDYYRVAPEEERPFGGASG